MKPQNKWLLVINGSYTISYVVGIIMGIVAYDGELIIQWRDITIYNLAIDIVINNVGVGLMLLLQGLTIIFPIIMFYFNGFGHGVGMSILFAIYEWRLLVVLVYYIIEMIALFIYTNIGVSFTFQALTNQEIDKRIQHLFQQIKRIALATGLLLIAAFIEAYIFNNILN